MLASYADQNMHQQRSYPSGHAKRALKREREVEAKKSRKINEFFVKTTAEVQKNELSISETTDNRADNHSKIDAKSDSNDNVELSSFSDIE